MLGRILNKLGRLFGRRLFKYDKGYLFELACQTFKGNNSDPSYPDGYLSRLATTEESSYIGGICDLPDSEINRRFESGDICFGVFNGSSPANVNWIHVGSCYVRGTGYIHRAEDNEKYVYGIVTDSSERGRGLYKNALIDLAHYLFKSDTSKIVQLAQEGNEPVLHSLPKLGYKLRKQITHFRILGIKYTVIRGIEDKTVRRDLFFREPKDIFFV